MHCNVVYNELVQERNHTHMNATHWVTLSAFVQYLGREGKVRGWVTEEVVGKPAAAAARVWRGTSVGVGG